MSWLRYYILSCNFLYSVFKVRIRWLSSSNGDNEIRTRDLLLARQALSQLSYTPIGIFIIFFEEVGLSGLEPPTSRLSGVRSNRLSYKPFFLWPGTHLLSHIVSNAVSSAA